MEDNHPQYKWQMEGNDCELCNGLGYTIVSSYDEDEQTWYNDDSVEICSCKKNNEEYDDQTDNSEDITLSE